MTSRCYFGKMNSNLGFVVPFAMFLGETKYIFPTLYCTVKASALKAVSMLIVIGEDRLDYSLFPDKENGIAD